MADLDSLVARLIRGEVNFVVVGGFAAIAHGATLTTQDLDICCSFQGDNLRRLLAAVADLHPVHRMTPRRKPLDPSDDSILGWRNLCLDTDLGRPLSLVRQPRAVEVDLRRRPGGQLVR